MYVQHNVYFSKRNVYFNINSHSVLFRIQSKLVCLHYWTLHINNQIKLTWTSPIPFELAQILELTSFGNL